MNQPHPEPLQDIIERLVALGERHNLIARALAGCRLWFVNEPDEMPYPLSDIRMEFWSQSLYFRNARLTYPYIETALRLFVGEEQVGYYRLITLLDGRDDDDYLVFE